MSRKLTTDTDLTAIANAIRTKGGTSAPLVYPTGFVSAIENIQSGTSYPEASGEYFGNYIFFVTLSFGKINITNQYFAPPGITWEEYIEGEDNTNFTIEEDFNHILYNAMILLDANGNYVLSNHQIMEYHHYATR